MTSPSQPEANAVKPAATPERPRRSIASAPAPTSARKPVVLDHAVAQHALAALRSKHTGADEFRAFSTQLLLLLAMEATRGLPTRDESVETFAGLHPGRALARPVVFITIRRQSHGLGQAVSQVIPEVLLGTISLGHSGGSERPEPRLHLASSPALGDTQVIVFEPVVASGLSVCAALDHLRRSGVHHVSLLSFVLSGTGLARIEAMMPQLPIWTAAIDREWDPKRGPLPGLGNFSERLYG